MMHALGFYHEHTRLHQDNFVQVHFENVKKGTYFFHCFDFGCCGLLLRFKLIQQFTYSIFSKHKLLLVIFDLPLSISESPTSLNIF